MDDTEFEEPPLAEKLDTQISFTDESLANSVLAGMHTLRQAGQLCDCVLRVSELRPSHIPLPCSLFQMQ